MHDVYYTVCSWAYYRTQYMLETRNIQAEMHLSLRSALAFLGCVRFFLLRRSFGASEPARRVRMCVCELLLLLLFIAFLFLFTTWVFFSFHYTILFNFPIELFKITNKHKKVINSFSAFHLQ